VSPFFSALGSLEKFQLPAPKGDDPPEDDGK
jgi:hypothetical protein